MALATVSKTYYQGFAPTIFRVKVPLVVCEPLMQRVITAHSDSLFVLGVSEIVNGLNLIMQGAFSKPVLYWVGVIFCSHNRLLRTILPLSSVCDIYNVLLG